MAGHQAARGWGTGGNLCVYTRDARACYTAYTFISFIHARTGTAGSEIFANEILCSYVRDGFAHGDEQKNTLTDVPERCKRNEHTQTGTFIVNQFIDYLIDVFYLFGSRRLYGWAVHYAAEQQRIPRRKRIASRVRTTEIHYYMYIVR